MEKRAAIILKGLNMIDLIEKDDWMTVKLQQSKIDQKVILEWEEKLFVLGLNNNYCVV